MSHECTECGQVCYCDGEDHGQPAPADCDHACQLIEDDDDGPACAYCGCTQDHACPGGCHWVAPFLCSACRDEGIRLYQIATGRAA